MDLQHVPTDELSAELARRQKQRAQLEARRERLLAELAAVEAQLGGASAPRAGSGSGGGAERAPAAPAAGKRTRARNSVSLGDALAQAMEVRAVVTPAEAAEYVRRNGYQSTARNFNMLVSNTLAKDPRFKRIARGQYERIA